MSTTEQEMEDVLPVEDDLIEDNGIAGDKPAPTGYLTHDEWIADGRDPEKFRGRKAFDDYGDSINTIKELKGQFATFDKTINVLKNQYETEANQKVEKAREEARIALEKAREDDDIQAFEVANNKLTMLDKATPQQQPDVQLNPSLAEFISNNPMLDRSSPQYDPEVFGDWESIYSSTLDGFIGGDRARQRELTQGKIDRSMKLAMRKAKDLSPEKFTSHRNKRPATATTTSPTKRSSSAPDYATRLKAMVTNGMNKNDRTATLDMYNILKKTNQAAADNYAKNVLGD